MTTGKLGVMGRGGIDVWEEQIGREVLIYELDADFSDNVQKR